MARDRISDLNDEMLVKILSFLPTKVAVATSVLSKRWKFLWMWLPNLSFESIVKGSLRDFIHKNLPLHKAPVIKSLYLGNYAIESAEAKDFKSWIEIAISRGVRELRIRYYLFFFEKHALISLLPSSLYTCNSLVSLTIGGYRILVDVPRTGCLPSLKTLDIGHVTYSNEDSLRLLLSYCPVLEDLDIEREMEDNLRALVIIIPSLQRLSLSINAGCSSDWCVIVTPSLKYFQVEDNRSDISYLIEHMPELEEANINVMENNQIEIEKLFKSITTVKDLLLEVQFNRGNKTAYRDGIVFSQLESLKLYIRSKNWSKILLQLLKDAPNLQTLDLEIDRFHKSDEYIADSWSDSQSSVPECLLKSLKTFKFEGSTGEQEERDFLSFIIKHACCLKSTSINIMESVSDKEEDNE